MGEHRIDLPNGLTVHAFKYLFEHVEFFPKQAPDAFVLSFNPKYSLFEPFAIAMLAAWASYWAAKGVPVRCENTSVKGVAYAQRMGLFKVLACEGLPSLEEHEEAGRFIPLQRIRDRTDIARFVTELGSILRDPELIRIGQHALSEMTRNVIEHARGEGFACAQYYPSNKRVAIGVADCGRGVRQSLQEAYGFRDDSDAILGALRPGVSGRSRAPYSASDNAGLGLFVARGLAKASRQYFLLASGSAAFRLDKATARPPLAPVRDASKEKHRLLTNFKPWNGTVVAVDLRGSERSFDLVMRSIGEVITEGAESRLVRSTIRFEP